MIKSEEQDINGLRAALEKEHNRPITDEETMEAYEFIKLMADIMVKNFFVETDRQNKLKDNPKGFHLEDGGTCGVCGQYVVNENSWYDKNGIKCMPCQNALDKKIIPVYVVNNKESWYSKYDLESYFKIGRTALKKYLKQGLLKKRAIPLEGKQVHLELFLISDNKSVLPPKKLLPSEMIKVEKDGEVFYMQANWYECIDEKGLKKLEKYKIREILRETFAKSIN